MIRFTSESIVLTSSYSQASVPMVKLNLRQPVALWTGDFDCLFRLDRVFYEHDETRQELDYMSMFTSPKRNPMAKLVQEFLMQDGQIIRAEPSKAKVKTFLNHSYRGTKSKNLRSQGYAKAA